MSDIYHYGFISHCEAEIQTDVSSVLSAAEYKTLCPGGEGFRPNPITVILEGKPCSYVCFPALLYQQLQPVTARALKIWQHL